MEFPSSVRPLFEQAGWRPERKVAPSIRHINAQAYLLGWTILSNLQGLHVGKSGPGRNCAASDIDFDPGVAEDWLEGPFGISDHSLCPIASYHNAHGALYIDGDGALYSGDLIGDSGIKLISKSFSEGVANVLLGIRTSETR